MHKSQCLLFTSLPFTAQSTYHLHLQHVPNMIELETWIASPRIPHTSTFSTLVWKQATANMFKLLNWYCTLPRLAKKKRMDVWLEWLDLLTAKWNQLISNRPAFYKSCLLPLSPAHLEKLIIPDFSKQQECLLHYKGKKKIMKHILPTSLLVPLVHLRFCAKERASSFDRCIQFVERRPRPLI